MARFGSGQGAGEDSFLGALLGLAIGDALGMPVEGVNRLDIARRFGTIDGYLPLTLADGSEVEPGQFTDETELGLCVVESLTVDRGRIDPDTIGPRFLYIARGESKRWLGAGTRRALAVADRTLEFVVPLDEDGPATGDVAARVAPVGLLHAVGRFDLAALRADAEQIVRLTHGSPAAITAGTAVAFGVQLAARREAARSDWLGATAGALGEGELAARLRMATGLIADGSDTATVLQRVGTGTAAVESVTAGFVAAGMAGSFSEAVLGAVNAGGDTDTVGAIAGVLAGAWFGASGIPQPLIDGLEGRIYVSLAAPWFYRTARQRAGLVIDLRLQDSGPLDPPPRPTKPPRV